MGRNLVFDSLDQGLAECEHLLSVGYSPMGKWTLAQICFHIRKTIEKNMAGYPAWMTILGYPLRPILRSAMLPRLLNGNSPKGIKTAGMFVPPENLDDRHELVALSECVSEFLDFKMPLHAHPGFGAMDHSQFHKFHAAHLAHHLNFLAPNSGS